MLTVDMVRATRRNNALHVTALKGKARDRAAQLAEVYLELAQAHVGETYAELKGLWAAVDTEAREAKLAAGLLKLVEDGCHFDAECPIEPRALRGELFLAATAARRARDPETGFDAERIAAEVGAPHGLTAQQVQDALYSDLKSEHRLVKAAEGSAQALVERYEMAQIQAVLLRAVQVTVQVRCATPADYRVLFRKLKFRRLLYTIEAMAGGEYRIVMDGPFSLFDQVTKYGLQLALMLPTLLQAEHLQLRADLRWGKQRSRTSFEFEHQEPRGGGKREQAAVRLPDEVANLLKAFQAGKKGWTGKPATEVFDLPGVGLCVPDLEFSHESGEKVFLEVMGYWSRDAVWKRVELVEKGLPQKMLFAASQRLRVSEAVLDDQPRAALYLYKGTLSPKAVLDRLEALREGKGL